MNPSTTPWHLGPLTGYDCETTGVNVETARIVTAAIIDHQPGLGDGPGELWLANPGVDIPAETTAVHGITNEQAINHGQPAAQVVAEISQHLADRLTANIPIVAMNARFDLTILDRECRRHQLPTLEQLLGRPVAPVVDPLILDKHVDTYRKGSRKLEVLAQHYGATLTDAHTANADAIAAVQVAIAIGARYPGLHMPAGELHDLTIKWAAAQAENFQAYKRRTQPGFIADIVWPVVPWQDPVSILRGEYAAMRTVIIGHLAEALLDGSSSEVRSWARGIAYELDVAGVNVDADIEAFAQRRTPGAPPLQPSQHPF